MARAFEAEDGAAAGVASFTRHLPWSSMICDISLFHGTPQLAAWYCPKSGMKLSHEAARMSRQSTSLCHGWPLEPYRPVDWIPDRSPGKALARVP
eukprot:CAMPEP_0175875476 /NCGR_PEP_ID=MMETSP0107_2-20121207/39481_1 /TAXON_ID=195067 ORGANISM="Goniomonas pacifica, Strain CCMP1869" /NCGR_SAMPLE_ID=MMETSP0107_2 /ASSEMBLY_ACC=CAM_ASM_000203 /LENGTH=94 /DNA_ID=CAMNT_0017194509 /DNA_START=12 /DNA_END=292 /DNA_ORIENTATION=+